MLHGILGIHFHRGSPDETIHHTSTCQRAVRRRGDKRERPGRLSEWGRQQAPALFAVSYVFDGAVKTRGDPDRLQLLAHARFGGRCLLGRARRLKTWKERYIFQVASGATAARHRQLGQCFLGSERATRAEMQCRAGNAAASPAVRRPIRPPERPTFSKMQYNI